MNMMKQLRQMKKMQKELARKTVEVSSQDGSVTVRASADMTVRKITIKADSLDPARSEQLGRTIASTVNGALDSCKKAAAEDMSKLTSGLNLPDMFGGV